MAGLISVVGATVEVTGAAAAAAELDTLAASADKVAASFERAGVAAKETSAGVKATTASTADATVATDAVLVGSTQKKTKAVSDLAKATDDAATKTKKLSQAVVDAGASSFGKFGRDTILAGIGVAYEGIKSYQQFQNAQLKLVTLGSVTKKQLPGLTSEEVKNAQKYAIALSDMSNASYRLASSTVGMKPAAANKLMKQMIPAFSQASTVLQANSGAQQESLARMFGALLKGKSGGLQGVGNPAHIAALLASMARAGDIQGTDIQSALGKGVILQGEALKMKLPDIMGAIDVATQYGQTPSTAGTLVSHALAMISNPSAQGTKTEEMFGIDQGTMRQIASTQGLGAAISYFNKSIKSGLNPTASLAPDSTIINGKRVYADQGTKAAAAYQLINWGVSIPTATALESGGKLTKQQETSLYNLVVGKSMGGGKQESTFLALAANPKIYDNIVKAIKTGATGAAFQKKLQESMETPAFKQKQLENNIKIDVMNIGKMLDPVWQKLLSGISDFVGWLSKGSVAAKALVAAVGGVAALGALTYLGGKAVSMYRGIAKTVGVVKSIGSKILGIGTTEETVAPIDAAGTQLITAAEALQLAAKALTGAATVEDSAAGMTDLERLDRSGGGLSPYGTVAGDAETGGAEAAGLGGAGIADAAAVPTLGVAGLVGSAAIGTGVAIATIAGVGKWAHDLFAPNSKTNPLQATLYNALNDPAKTGLKMGTLMGTMPRGGGQYVYAALEQQVHGIPSLDKILRRQGATSGQIIAANKQAIGLQTADVASKAYSKTAAAIKKTNDSFLSPQAKQNKEATEIAGSANKLGTQASSDQVAASKEQTQAAKDTQQAAKLSGPAAKQLQTSAKVEQDAANAHKAAAAKLNASAEALTAAAMHLASTQVTVSSQALVKSVLSSLQTAQARGK